MNNLIKKYEHDAAYDIRSATETIIMPLGNVVIETGLHINIPIGWEGTIQSRSGLAMNNSLESSNAGVIDSGYKDAVSIKLYNMSSTNPIEIKYGSRIAQIKFGLSGTVPAWRFLFKKIPHQIPNVSNLNMFDDSERGFNGIGSTGIE